LTASRHIKHTRFPH